MTYKRKEIIGDCTLYLGDMREVLEELGECADCVVTDPPYKLEQGGRSETDKRRMKGKFAHDKYTNNGEIINCEIEWHEFMPVIYKSLIGNSHAYVMSNNRHVQNLLNTAEQAGFKFHNLLIWEKNNATANPWYMKNCEFTGFFFKGKAKYVTDMGAKQHIKIPQQPYGDHPTVKPVTLMKHYIEQSTVIGQTVLDPFMGSCATGAACVQAGRKFIGIEIEEKYFDLSCKRIEDSSKQGDFFSSIMRENIQDKLI